MRNSYWAKDTNSEEKPLQQNTISIRIVDGVESEFEVLVVVLDEVQEDGRRLEDRKVVSRAINENGNAAVGVQLDKPWFLLECIS